MVSGSLIPHIAIVALRQCTVTHGDEGIGLDVDGFATARSCDVAHSAGLRDAVF